MSKCLPYKSAGHVGESMYTGLLQESMLEEMIAFGKEESDRAERYIRELEDQVYNQWYFSSQDTITLPLLAS